MNNPLGHFIHTSNYDRELSTAKRFVQEKRKILHDNLSKDKWVVCKKCNGNGIIPYKYPEAKNTGWKNCEKCKGSGVRRIGK